jgi:hypothetical protein
MQGEHFEALLLDPNFGAIDRRIPIHDFRRQSATPLDQRLHR